jgi:hypothetical protein
MSDSLSTVHPQYADRVREWEQCRDVWRGEHWVKLRDNGVRYLPPTQGMIANGLYASPNSVILNPTSPGYSSYQAYLTRAVLHSFFRDAVQMLMGLMWNKPASYKLKGIEFIEKKATSRAETLQQLHMRINEQQLAVGRLGLLSDLSAAATLSAPQPYISLYEAESITNWDGGFRGEIPVEVLNLVVLNESGYKRKGIFEWDWHEQYRVLMLGSPGNNEPSGVYTQGLFAQQDTTGPLFDESLMLAPGYRGQPLDEIPFTFVNAQSTISSIDDPPLLGLSDLVLALYRLEADYRQELHASTQATPWIRGVNMDPNKPLQVGAGAYLDLGNNPGAECGFLELSGRGLPELRNAVTADKELAKQKAGEMVDTNSRARESGTAMTQRIGTKTATLNQIAVSGAEALTKALRHVAKLAGVKDLEAIEVVPSMDFATKDFDATSYLALVQAKMTHGAPISLESVHRYSVDQGYTTLSFDDMMKQLEAEKQLLKDITPEIPIDPNKKMAVEASLKKQENKPKPAPAK